jgi:hypothetical protein
MAQARQLVLTEEQYRDLFDCREHRPKASMREKAAAILKVASGQAVRRVAAHGLLRPLSLPGISNLLRRLGVSYQRGLAAAQAGSHPLAASRLERLRGPAALRWLSLRD